VKQGVNFIGILIGYSGAGCELPKFAGYTQAGCELPSGYSQVGCKPPREEGLQGLSFGGWITFEFARFSWCDKRFKIENVFQWLEVGVCTRG
jgi:hypothetical protein